MEKIHPNYKIKKKKNSLFPLNYVEEFIRVKLRHKHLVALNL